MDYCLLCDDPVGEVVPNMSGCMTTWRKVGPIVTETSKECLI